jgi:hypothetical protein
MGRRSGQMGRFMRGFIQKGKRLGKEGLLFQINLGMKENFLTIKSME